MLQLFTIEDITICFRLSVTLQNSKLNKISRIFIQSIERERIDALRSAKPVPLQLKLSPVCDKRSTAFLEQTLAQGSRFSVAEKRSQTNWNMQ